MCTTKVSLTLATMSPLAAINMPELSMATCPWGSVSTVKVSPADAATARCTSNRSGMRRLSHSIEPAPTLPPTWNRAQVSAVRYSWCVCAANCSGRTELGDLARRTERAHRHRPASWSTVTARCGAELRDLSGHVHGCHVRAGLRVERWLVGGGQAQHGAGHQRRRTDLRLHRPQPDGQV